jgi:hypothetical protein
MDLKASVLSTLPETSLTEMKKLSLFTEEELRSF